MQALVKISAGIDVHREVVVVAIARKTGEKEDDIEFEMKEFSTFRSDLKNLAVWLKKLSVELAVMEATGIYWKGVYEALEDAEVTAIVVNAQHVKNVPGRKTDANDSRWLAQLAMFGLLRASFIPIRDFRELRMLTRYRVKLIGIFASEKNRLHKLLDACGIKLGCVVSDIDGVTARLMIDALIDGELTPSAIAKIGRNRLHSDESEVAGSLDGRMSDRDRFLLKQIRDHIRWIDEIRRKLDEQVVTAMTPYEKQWHLLQTMPGFDEINAAMLLAEIGIDMGQFKTKGRLSAWAGLCPGNNESAGKKRSARIRKGNPYVKRLMCESAHSAVKTRCQFKGQFDGLIIRRGKKRAIVAIAHKMLEVAFVILKTGRPYEELGVNYQELMVKRNAPRWIKKLREFGYLAKVD